MKKDPYERCINCKFRDNKTSNENWLVCSKMPLIVITEGCSNNCDRYEAVNGTSDDKSLQDIEAGK